ncbi:DUF4347 domain-containing protein [Vacuolonema iberomarrocanum]|uniref:DUF4347 domain-containing protein n=1 Tax=Vacuolonema iberomarrocanum TaxID=3454632 RepID=UPI0019EF1A9F|nr:DUF4347 domain-containing protein [filamentous cyanobacterium LEGE 07170]
MSNANSVVFIDSQVQDSADLITGIAADTSIYHLGNSRDGVTQISETLAQYQNLDAVYIVSHGSEGSLDLGTAVLSLETLDDYGQELSGWSQALSEEADLLFFGCNVAQGEQGQAFMQQLDTLTGADIAASTDLTGQAELKGDWILEAATGTIEAHVPFAVDSLNSFEGTLASLSGGLTGTRDFTDHTTVDGDLFLDGDVILNVGDFTLGSDFKIAGDAQGERDSLFINAFGKVTIAGDIFGGGLQNITINASEIEIQGTSLISTRFIEGGNYDTDLSTGDSGNLTLGVNDAVTIQAGAELFTHVGSDDTETAGNIEITVLDETVQTGLAIIPTQPQRSASINIDGATLKGNDVTVSASGLDPKLFGDVIDFPGVQFLDKVVIDPLLEGRAAFLQGLVLPASVEFRRSHAEATVTGSTIEASGAVTISTEATADGSVKSIRATRTPESSQSLGAQAYNFLSHFAVAVGYAETDAVTKVEGTTITAGADVSLTSTIETTAAVDARLFGNLQVAGQGASSTNWGFAAAVSITDTTSKVTLDEDSSIVSGGNVAIMSGGKVTSKAKAKTSIFTTGNFASSVAVNHDDTNVETLVQGDITAAGSITKAEPTQIESDNVNGEDDTISFEDSHGFGQGETVTYQNAGNGSDIAGLTDGQIYTVHLEDDQTIKLSRGPALDVGVGGVNQGAMHSLSRLGTQTITQVDIETDQITLENHGLLTGQQVIYRSNADEEEGIDGLFEEISYFVRVVDENTIELAGDIDQLAAGQKIDLESTGISDNTYELEFYEQEERIQEFVPGTVIDVDADTLSLDDHGFYNGQLVRYNSSGNSDPMGGIDDEQYYFVIVNDSNRIQLAATQQDVINGVAIDLTTQGSGTDHRLTGIQNATRFEAKTAVDSEKDVFTVNNHGFQTRDAVVYDTDATFTTEAPVAINRTLDPSQQVDIANNTLSIAAQTLETGDKVTYQAAYALDAESAQYQAIGGLTSNTEYYLIKLDDETVQLAASREQALANEAIDLTAVGTGSFHTLFSVGKEVVQVEDREISGLEAAEVYYVSVIDDHTFRLTQTPEEAVNAEFVDFDGADFGGNHRLAPQESEFPPGITLEATLEADDRANASGAARSTPKIRDYLQNPDLIANLFVGGGGGLLDQTQASDILKGKKGPFDKISGTNKHSVGLGVAANLVDHKVRVEVGSDENGTDFDTILNTNENIRVHAGIEQKVQTRASGATGKSESGGALGLAIGFSKYDNTAQAIVHGNAQLNATDTIDVTSKVEYPFLFTTDKLPGPKNDLDKEENIEGGLKLAEIIGIQGLFGGNLLLSQVTNTFANTKNTGKIDKGQIKGGTVGLNGTIAVNDYNNVSQALIKSGAQINQNTAYQTEQQSVNVQADTDMLLVGLVGILHMDFALDTGLAGVKKKGWQSVFNPWGNTAQNGVGVSALAELLNNKTIAKIERGAQIHTGTQGAGLDVNAKENVVLVALTQSGAQVEGFGLAGAGAGFDHTSHTIAQLESGVTVTGGPLSIQAHSDVVRVNSAMTLVNTKNTGVGFAVAIDESDRHVRAVIGDAKADDEVLAIYQSNAELTANTSIDVVGDIEVNAKTTGAVVSAALGFNWLSPTGYVPLETNVVSPDSIKNLTGVTGGIAGNVQTETVKAYVYDAQGNGHIKARQGGDLKVKSENQTLTMALGALLTAAHPAGGNPGISENQNVVAATLGAGFNQVDHTTLAFIEGVDVEANALRITADKDRTKGSRTLALAITPSITASGAGQGSFTANVSGAVALNQVNSTTKSYAKNSTLQVEGNTTFAATDKSRYYAAGGALALGVLTSGSNYKGTGTLGFGFGFNEVNSTTESYLDQSSLTVLSSATNPNNQIDITALADFESVALSLSGAVSSNTGMNHTGGSGLSISGAVVGAVSINEIKQNTVSAYVSDSTIDASNQNLTVKAEDSSHILGIGGGLSISAITHKDTPIALSIGASAAVNTFANTTVEAYLSQSTVSANTVDLTASSTAESGAYAIIGSGAGTSANESSNGWSGALALAGAGTGNYGSSHISAQVDDAQIYTGALAIHALDETELKSYAIGLAVGAGLNFNSTASAATVGAGVAVALNEVRNDVHANIKGASTINRLGNNGQVDVDLQALSTPEIKSVNVAGAAAVAGSSQGELGLGIAAGVSAAHSTLSNTVTATVEDGSSIQNGGIVSVQALLGQVDDTAPSTLHTVGGSASLAAAWSQNLGGSLAVAASVARNYVEDNTVLATINNSTVTANDDITVTADFSPAVDTTNFGVALGVGVGSGNSSGIGLAGAGIGSYNTLINNTTEASVTNGANITSQAGNVALKATDATHLKAHGGTGSLAIGGASGGLGFSAAIGAAVAKNKLANTTKADISGATVKAHQNLTVEAKADNDIDALNIGVGAAVGGSSDGGGIGLAGTGIGSYNTLSNTVAATIQAGTEATAETGAVRLAAIDTSTIKADGGAGSLALGLGSGVDISAAIGVSVAENDLTNTLEAFIDDATVTAHQNLTVEAQADNDIDALNISVGVAGGGSQDGGGIGLAGAGIGSYNTLSNTVAATIRAGAEATAATGAVRLTATDTSTIKADGGTGSLALGGAASGVGVGAAIGASVAENNLTNTLEASINDATVRAHQDLTVEAQADNTIDALNIGVGAAGGVSFDSVGLGAAGAGIGSYNTLSNTVAAAIQGGAEATSETDSIYLTATDTSSIKADGGAGSLAFGGGSSVGGSFGIGVAIAQNTLENTLKASIDEAIATAEKDVVINAATQNADGSKSASIEAVSVGASVAGAIGGSGGVALAGAGVGADNTLRNTIEASIQNSQVTSDTGKVSLDAKDQSKIDAKSYVVGISAAGGSSGAGAGTVGIAKATNTLNSQVKALVGHGDNTPDSSHIQAQALDVTATSDTDIDAKVVTAGVAIAVAVNPASPIAVGVSGSGVIADNTISNTVEAAVRNGSMLEIADTIDVTASDTSTVEADYGLGSSSFGVLAGISIAVASTENTVDNTIQTYMDNVRWAGSSQPDVTIQATETATLTTDNRFASVGAGIIGLAGAGASSKTTLNSTTEAYAKGNQDWSVGDLTIAADSNTDSTVKVHGGAVNAAALAAAAGASLATVEDNSQATAYFDLDNSAVLKAQDVDITATATPKATADALFVGVAASVGLAGAGSEATATINPMVTAYVGEGTTIQADNLTVQAEQAKPENSDASVSAIATTGEGGVGLSLGFTYADAHADGTVKAYIDDNARIFTANDVTVAAINNTQQFAGKDGVANGGFNIGVTGGELRADTHSNKITEAYLGNNIALVAQNLTLQAEGENQANVAGVTFGGAVGIAGRAGHAETQSTSTTRAYIGEGNASRRLKVFDVFDLNARYTNTFDKDLVVGTGAIFFAGSGANATHTIDSTVEAQFSNNLQIEAGNIQVDALNTSRKLNKDKTSLRSATGSLGLSVAKLESRTDITHHTDVQVGSGAALRQNSPTATDGIDIKAKNVIDVKESVTAKSYGIISGGGVGKAEIIVNSDADIDLDQGSLLDASGDINLNSHSYNQAHTVSKVSTSGVISGGKVTTKTHVTPNDTITLHDDAKLLSHGEVALTAGISGTDLTGTEESDSREQSIVRANANVTIYALAPVTSRNASDVETIYDRTHTITVNNGAEIASAKDTRLFAHAGSPTVAEEGQIHHLYGAKDFDDGVSQTDTIGVTVDGTVRSRRIEAKTITFEEGANGTIQAVHQAVIDGEVMQLGSTETVGITPPDGITLYQGAYQGDRTVLGVGRYANLADGDLAAFNNAISALKVAAGYQAVLYTEANFQGDRLVIKSDTDLAQLGSFNNQVSSLEILHDPDSVIGYRYENQTNPSGAAGTPKTPLGEMVTVTGTLGLRDDLTNLYIGDFNGDGKDDFIRQEKGSRDNDSSNTAQAYISQGDGSFSRHNLPESFALKGDSTTLYIGDFNGDGKDDFLSQSNSSDTAQIFWSQGNGSFTEYNLPNNFKVRGSLTNLYIGDFNGDGKDDFIRQEKGSRDNDNNNTANVFLSHGNGSFSKHNLPNELKGDLTNLYIGDFNDDGKDDFIRQEKGAWDNNSSNTGNVFLSNGNGSFAKHNLPENFAIKGDNTNLYIGDFNGDGKDDFIRQEKIGNSSDNTADVFLSDGNGSFAKHTLPENFNLKGDLTNLYVGDFNGDGKDDFMRQAKSGNGTADVFLSNGNGSFAQRDRTESLADILGGNQSRLHMGDFNGDGNADVFQHVDGNDAGSIMHGFSEASLDALEAEANFREQFSTDAISNTPIIEIADTGLDLGRILVAGGYLNGTGTLDAAANSKLEILNSSRASLHVNDIDLSDTGGGLYFNYVPLGTNETDTTASINASINSANKGNGANFAAVNTLATEGRPEVNIENTAGSRTSIQLDGDINNLLGTIRADNAIGDTIVNGNLRAHTIDIATGGSVIQGYISGNRYLGGAPESQWWQTAEASALAGQKENQGSDNSDSTIIGDNVFIAGKHINVNGTIQAGRANHSVVITDNTQFQQAIANFNQQYASNNGQHLFDFSASGHGITTAGNDHKQVRLQWNARDQQIEAYNLDVTGGYLELHGQIFSTGNGQLKALDGYAQIQIENNTDYDLKLNALTNNEVEGKIKITDTSRSGNSPYGFHVTEIERLGNTIHTTVNGALSVETTGRTTTYDPKANQVYRFETEQLRLETKYMRRKQKGTALGSSFFRIVTSDKTYERDDLTVTNEDVVELRGGRGQLVSNITQDELYKFEHLNQVTVDSWSTDRRYSGVYSASTRRHWDWEEFRHYYQLHRHSIDADRAIAINFIGYDEGILNVQSDQSTVILDGILSNTGGDTTIAAKAISTTDEGSLWSDQVALTAQNDIDLSIEGSADGGTVEATTTNGNLNLTYLNSVVNEATLTAQNGDVTFTAHAGINGTFTGNDITLAAIAGAITATVNTGESATTGLTAEAKDEIHLTGMPQIHQVSSSAGIYLNGESQGTLLKGQTTVEAEYQTLLTDFTEFASAAAMDDHFAAIEAAKQAEYAQYWQIRNQMGDTFDPATDAFTYSADQRADLQAEGKTEVEITALEQAATEWMRSRHAEFGNPTAYDANYNQVSEAERSQLAATLAQTQQSWQDQVDILGGYQNFQSFWGTIYSDEASLGAIDVPIFNSVVAGGGSGGGSQPPANSGDHNPPQYYQIYNETTDETTIVNRDDLLAMLTEEQRDALMQAEANGASD